jgi:hypothetical protein
MAENPVTRRAPRTMPAGGHRGEARQSIGATARLPGARPGGVDARPDRPTLIGWLRGVRLTPNLSRVAVALRRGMACLPARRRQRRRPLALAPLEDAADVAALLEAISNTLGRSGGTAIEAAARSEVVVACRRAFAICEFDRRLKALETAANAAKP